MSVIMKGEYEQRFRYTGTPGVHRRARSVSSIRRRNSTDSFRSTLHTCAERTCVQEKVSGKSQSQRTQTEGHPRGLGPRLPARPGLVDRFRFVHLAGEFRIGQSLTHDLTKDRKSTRL